MGNVPMGEQNTREILEAINIAIKKDIIDIANSFKDKLPKENIINEEINLFNKLIESLSQENKLTKNEERCAELFNKLSLIGNLYSQIDIIDDKLSMLEATSINMSILRPIFSKFKSLLKSLSTHLWQLISRLMTPKEWSIHGGISPPNLFGLSGNVQIKITFG